MKYFINIIDDDLNNVYGEFETDKSVVAYDGLKYAHINAVDNRTTLEFNQPMALIEVDDNILRLTPHYENLEWILEIFGE